jgi:DNA topoisomerase-2
VHFKLYGKQKAISDLSDPVKGYKALKLESRISTNNMNAFNADGVIVKYDSPEAIVDGWFPVRLALYADRKKDMLLKLGHTVRVLGNRARFIEAVVGGDLELFNGKKTRLQVVEELEKMGFDTRAALDGLLEGAAGAEEAGGAEEGAGRLKSFDYLLSTPVSSFTRDKIEALEREKETEEAAFAELQETSEQLMWLRDLDALEDALQ